MTDARIEDWIKVGDVIYGTVYEDSKSRFKDGDGIVTSRLVSVDDNIAKTLNSTYKLGAPYKNG